MTGRGPVLTALAIICDRDLAGRFSSALERGRSFQILSEFKSYPTPQTLEIRVRQTKPDVILLDLASDLDRACELIRCVACTVCCNPARWKKPKRVPSWPFPAPSQAPGRRHWRRKPRSRCAAPLRNAFCWPTSI